jgi:hypothetical protein
MLSRGDARGGFFHSDTMHLVGKFTRQGNQIKYEVTVDDPEVLAEPWVMTPRTMRLLPNTAAGLLREREGLQACFVSAGAVENQPDRTGHHQHDHDNERHSNGRRHLSADTGC